MGGRDQDARGQSQIIGFITQGGNTLLLPSGYGPDTQHSHTRTLTHSHTQENADMPEPIALIIGTGEYTTGYVHGSASGSDKSAGVVALVFFDLRRRGKIGEIRLAGTNGTKFPGIREHFRKLIAERYKGMDTRFDSFPADDVASDPQAYRAALDTLSPGDVVAIFTPDDTHYAIATDAVERGCHVLIAKPAVKTLEEHLSLLDRARRKNVIAAVEVHKRWDPMYTDARDRIRGLGDFSYFYSYMSQPKKQLETFRQWAGKSSDISYYLNAHHVDFLAWAIQNRARPVRIAARAATGVAESRYALPAEDTITLTVDWENLQGGNRGVSIHTASWIAPKSDVHSQQRFHYMGHEGEIQVDQAHRGYSVATDEAGYASPNPLFMKYVPDAAGDFAGQSGYGYKSIEAFVDAANAVRVGTQPPEEFRESLATLQETIAATAILEGGRRSLDLGGCGIRVEYDSQGDITGLAPEA